MSSLGAHGAAAPSPDAVRINRLDRLLDTLGEHQLTIRQQGYSVVDLAERLRLLETAVQSHSQALHPLQSVDVRGELDAANACIERLQAAAAAAAREAGEARVQQELRLQAAEQRQAAADVRVQQVEEALEAAAGEQAAALDDLRQVTKGMLSEVVRKVADQFDAVQGALEEAIASRAAEQEAQRAAAAALQRSVAEARAWAAEQAAALSAAAEGRAEARHGALERRVEEHAAALRQHADALETAGRAAQEQAAAVAALEAGAAAAAGREAGASEVLQEALAVWQHGVEAQMEELAGKVEQYKQYVSRLRREAREARERSGAAQGAAAAALGRELAGAGGGMLALQRETATLLGALHGVGTAVGGVDAELRGAA